ncbi:MAG: type II toxin-antitoxin system RelE/ParE family toxin [Candidatus Schekmanbacteria bacterium]|nr:type II toxin-antitoxin system RelE/ParE family toxin [Candidatus Schekmanbacteria bacterium]
MFNIALHKKAMAYNQLDDKTADRVNDALESITEHPFEHSNIKKLKGEFEGSYRYRLGSLRIIYSVNLENNTVFVEAIGSRGDIYKR